MEKKYVPSGVCLVCDKGTLPSMLTVTSNLTTEIYGVQLATESDKLPLVNIPPMGVCAVTHIPCVVQPSPIGWSPVQNTVIIGGQRLLLEDSKLRCMAGGQVSLQFVAPPAPPSPPGLLDAIDAKLAELGPAGNPLRFQMGVAEGVVGGVVSLAEGLWSLGKLAVKAQTSYMDAMLHPVETAQSAWKGATAAADWASKGENWNHAWEASQQALGKADQAMYDAHDWVADGGIQKWASQQSPRDWGKLGGRGAFEVAMLVGTGGAGEAANAMGKAGEAANLAEKGLEVANLTEKGAEAANAAGKLKLSGPVVTGAEEAAEAVRAAKAAEEAAAAEKAAKELETVEGAAKDKRTCKVDPVDVTNGVMLFDNLDVELPGPVPFHWERTWYSNSEHQGMLGHGWHHQYDLALWVSPDGLVACRLADGRLALFDPLNEDNEFYAFNRKEKLELRQAKASYQLYDCSNRLQYSFAPCGQRAGHYQLQTVGNTSGLAIRFRYNEHGHLHIIIDSAGRELRLQTDTVGRILTLELPHPTAVGQYFRAMQYDYDEVGNMTAATDALGNRLEYAYRGHLMVQKRFRNGMSFYFEYDGTDSTARCVRSWGDGNLLNGRFVYEPGHTVFTTDLPGDRSEYFHQNGLVTAHLDPVGALREWHYNAFDELELERDPLGHSTVYDYDARGHLAGVTYPDGINVQARFSLQGLPTYGIDANGNASQWEYDINGRLLAKINSNGDITHSYTYDAKGQLASITDALNQTTRLRYDDQGNLMQLTAPDGSNRARTYDVLGRMTQVTNATGNIEHRGYDLLGRLLSVQQPDGTIQQFVYDALGNVLHSSDGAEEIELRYNPIGQLAKRTQGGQEISFDYDLAGRLTTVRNEKGEVYRFVLDALGRITKEIGFDGITRIYERDSAGRVIRIRRPAGRTTEYTYNTAGRVAEVIYNGTERTTYRYRSDGTMLEATTADTNIQFELGPLGQVAGEVQNGHAVTSEYDAIGQRIALRSSLGAEASFAHDLLGRPIGIVTANWFSESERDSEGAVFHRSFSSGIHISWLRDTHGRPINQRIEIESIVERQRRYQWQGIDQLAAIEDSISGNTRYSYDQRGRLSAAYSSIESAGELRHPDAVGNLFGTFDRSDRRYTKGGQLQEASGVRYKYDPEGNLLQKTLPNGQHWQYEWDGAGQLICVTRPDNYKVNFIYDAFGRRVSKRYRGRVTRWVWDGDKPLHEWTELEVGPGPLNIDDITTWLFEEDSFTPSAKLTKQGAHSVVHDHLGTPLAMYSASGTRTWEMTLGTYGQVQVGKGHAHDCPFRYQGQYEDVETGLYYNRFRYYSPEEGTYISQDPIGLVSGELNLYSYVSDVNKLIDVFGLYPLWDPNTLRWRDSVTGRFRARPTDLVRTKPGEAFFWSGRTPKPDGTFGGGAKAAEGIARAENGTTLEMLIEKHGIQMPDWDPANPVNTREWSLLSQGYAEGVSGPVRGVIGEQLRPDNIWENSELTALRKNPNVTEIVTIDPVTQVRKKIYPACPGA